MRRIYKNLLIASPTPHYRFCTDPRWIALQICLQLHGRSRQDSQWPFLCPRGIKILLPRSLDGSCGYKFARTAARRHTSWCGGDISSISISITISHAPPELSTNSVSDNRSAPIKVGQLSLSCPALHSHCWPAGIRTSDQVTEALLCNCY